MIQQKNPIQPTKNIYLIRHGQSFINKAVHDFKQQNKLQYCWQTFTSYDHFNNKIIYNSQYCDCGISQKGKKQCLQAKQKLKDTAIDLIIVSPLQRALQTCKNIFQHQLSTTKIIVQPLLAESLKYSSDISSPLIQKQLKYPLYDFDNIKIQGDYWYLKNQTQQNQKLYFEHLSVYPHYTYKQKQKQLSKFMQRTKIRQSNQNMRIRADKIKQMIKQYSLKYNNIVIISHFYTIKHILTKKISKNAQPSEQFHGPNCSIHQLTLQKLLLPVQRH